MKRLVLCLISITISVNVIAGPGFSVQQLQCGNTANALGVDINKIRLSWQISSEELNVFQSNYRIMVADSPEKLSRGTANIWDSGKIKSSQSLQVAYSGIKLVSGKRYYWLVKVWVNGTKEAAVSKIAYWETGLSQKADWKGARWIGYEKSNEDELQVPLLSGNAIPKESKVKDVLPLLRKELKVLAPVKQASLFISGLGQFELSLNGEKVGDHFLDPGWTKYDKHAEYVVFDVTKILKPGLNTLGVMLGNGFYHIPNERYRKMTGSFGNPKMICLLKIEYTDGTNINVISDSSWKTSSGPVTFSSIYGGEDYDARREQPNWNVSGFNDSKWKNAVIVDGPPTLTAQLQAPLKVFDEFKAVKISQLKPGVYIYDFGQNASGIPSFSITGEKGKSVKITPAELIEADGDINQKPSGSPTWFNYTLKGEGTESWKPQFMYYGFKFLKIEGAVPQGMPNPENLPVIQEIKSLHTRNSAETVGTFECSNPLFNQIFKLIDWSVKSNMSSVLTDCPHREKLGWLEVPHLLGNSLRYNYDIATFYRKINQDMRMSQTESGLIPSISPEFTVFDKDFRDSPEWGSSCVILPWDLFQWYGDIDALKENYPMMKSYVDFLEAKSTNHIVNHGLGDWFDIGPNGSGSGYSINTPMGITGTAIYYLDLNILVKVARLLKHDEDVERYQRLAYETKVAFNQKFFNQGTKQYGTGSQTANAMALYMNLVEPQYKNVVMENLVSDIKNKDYKLTAGEVGFKYLLSVLEDGGRSDVIFAMNNRSDVPGYGYQLAHGATTLMEDWQAIPSLGNNHCMLGHLLGWFYSGIGGIRQDEGGIAFNKIVIRPEIVGDINYAKTTHLSPYGLIKTDWTKEKGRFRLNVEIPPNTTASIYLPVTSDAKVTQNGIAVKSQEIIKVGSGKYVFIVQTTE